MSPILEPYFQLFSLFFVWDPKNQMFDRFLDLVSLSNSMNVRRMCAIL